MRDLSEELKEAYLNTEYLIALDSGELNIRIGRYKPDMEAVLTAYQVSVAAFLTACNPRSQRQPEPRNRAASERLVARVSELGLSALQGRGHDPTGKWPDEQSLLVLGINQEEAHELACEYEQNAFVMLKKGAAPELVWTKF